MSSSMSCQSSRLIHLGFMQSSKRTVPIISTNRTEQSCYLRSDFNMHSPLRNEIFLPSLFLSLPSFLPQKKRHLGSLEDKTLRSSNSSWVLATIPTIVRNKQSLTFTDYFLFAKHHARSFVSTISFLPLNNSLSQVFSLPCVGNLKQKKQKQKQEV